MQKKGIQIQIKRLEKEVRDKEIELAEALRGTHETLSTDWQMWYDLYEKMQTEKVKLTERNVAFQQEQIKSGTIEPRTF